MIELLSGYLWTVALVFVKKTLLLVHWVIHGVIGAFIVIYFGHPALEFLDSGKLEEQVFRKTMRRFRRKVEREGIRKDIKE